MSKDFQKTIITGRFVRSPEVKELGNDKTVANFTIACGEEWKNAAGETQSETAFVKCEAWSGLARTIGKYCDQGKQVLVSGKLKTKSWEDKTTKAKRSELILKVEDMQFLGSKGDGQSTGGHSDARAPQRPSAPANEPDFDDSESPF